jgi:hypothetical protein
MHGSWEGTVGKELFRFCPLPWRIWFILVTQVFVEYASMWLLTLTYVLTWILVGWVFLLTAWFVQARLMSLGTRIVLCSWSPVVRKNISWVRICTLLRSPGQESIPRSRFRQPGGPVRQKGLSYRPTRLGIDSWALLKKFTNLGSKAKFLVPDWGIKSTLAWGCRRLHGWLAGTTNLCQNRLYSPVRD